MIVIIIIIINKINIIIIDNICYYDWLLLLINKKSWLILNL